jgi:hypothetical protein
MSEKKTVSPKIKKPDLDTPDQPNSHWVKILYYYLLIAGCLLFFSIGLYWLSRTVIINSLFPQVNQNKFSYIDEYKRDKQINIDYQQNILNSTLLMIVTVIIYFIYKKIIKIKD